MPGIFKTKGKKKLKRGKKRGKKLNPHKNVHNLKIGKGQVIACNYWLRQTDRIGPDINMIYRHNYVRGT